MTNVNVQPEIQKSPAIDLIIKVCPLIFEEERALLGIYSSLVLNYIILALLWSVLHFSFCTCVCSHMWWRGNKRNWRNNENRKQTVEKKQECNRGIREAKLSCVSPPVWSVISLLCPFLFFMIMKTLFNMNLLKLQSQNQGAAKKEKKAKLLRASCCCGLLNQTQAESLTT